MFFLSQIMPCGIEELPNFDCSSCMVSLFAAYIERDGL